MTKCLWCKKKLNKSQEYDFNRGKQKQTCSRSCGQLLYNWVNIEQLEYKKISLCIDCNKQMINTRTYNKKIKCSSCIKLASSNRMIKKNPMHNKLTREKVSKTLKKMKWKPKIQGGNGRGLTKQQANLLEALPDDTFTAEFIQKTGIPNRTKYKCPTHYKIDIASKKHMIAIEVDGVSHNSLKVKICDNKKDKTLNSLGWTVLRFTNQEIDNDMNRCVEMVMSMI